MVIEDERQIASRSIVEATFKKFGFDNRVDKVFDAWESLDEKLKSGCRIKMVGARTRDVVISAPSSVARHKIFHTKNKIISAINNFIGENYIKDIKVELE